MSICLSNPWKNNSHTAVSNYYPAELIEVLEELNV